MILSELEIVLKLFFINKARSPIIYSKLFFPVYLPKSLHLKMSLKKSASKLKK